MGRYPLAVAVTPDGKTAYVASADPRTVTPINTATGTPGRTIKVGSSPTMIAITPSATTPNGATAYVVDSPAAAGSMVTPIATATSEPGAPIRVAGPYTYLTGIAFAP